MDDAAHICVRDLHRARMSLFTQVLSSAAHERSFAARKYQQCPTAPLERQKISIWFSSVKNLAPVCPIRTDLSCDQHVYNKLQCLLHVRYDGKLAAAWRKNHRLLVLLTFLSIDLASYISAAQLN